MKPSLFSEEGRVARHGWSGTMLIAGGLLILSIMVGYFTFTRFTKPNMTVLQRVYLPAYYHSAWLSTLSPWDTKSNYLLLVRVVADPKTKNETSLLCLDREVGAIYGDDGKIQLTKEGFPDIRIKQSYFDQSKRVGWDRQTWSDGAAYKLFRQFIFEDKAFYQLFYPSLLSGGLIFFPGLIGAVIFQRRRTKRYLKGKPVRGTRELSPKEYEDLHRRDTGIGLEVLPHEGGD
jgi:hypothetical protein